MGPYKSRPSHPPIPPERGECVAYMIIPPDGGWGWVIVLASFIGFAIVDGFAFSFSIFRREIAKSFSISTTSVAVMGSISSGMALCVVIFACAVANRYDFRLTMILGAVLAGTSYAVTSLLNNIIIMDVIFGIVGGTGTAFLVVSIVIPPGVYFSKKRPLAMGLCTSGSAVGALCIPQLVQHCVKAYGWRKSMLIQVGVTSIFIILGILMRPLDPVKVRIKKNEDGGETETLAEEFQYTTFPDLKSQKDTDSSEIYSADVTNVTGASKSKDVLSEYSTLSKIKENKRATIILENASASMLRRLQQMTHTNKVYDTPSLTKTERTLGERSSIITVATRSEGPKEKLVGFRPLYRTDILYEGSILRLEEYNTKEREIDYHLDVTMPATWKDINEEKKCSLCPEAIKRGLRILINFNLLKSPTFILIIISAFFNFFSFYIPFLYIGEKLSSYGMDSYKSLSISVIGVGLGFGRLLCGTILMVIPNFKAIVFCIISIALAGLACFATTLYNEISYSIVCMAIYGIAAGAFIPLRSVIIVDYMGLENLTTATGMIIFFQGIGSLSGAPIADLIYAKTQNINASFYLSGVCLLLSSIFLFLSKIVNTWKVNTSTS